MWCRQRHIVSVIKKNKTTQNQTEIQAITLKSTSKCYLRDYKNIKPNPEGSVIHRIIMEASTCNSFSRRWWNARNVSWQQSKPVVYQRAGLSLLLCHLHPEPLHLPLLPSGSASYLSRTPAAAPVLFQHWDTESSFLLTWSQAGLISLYLEGFIFLQALCKSLPRRTCQKEWEELSHLPLGVPNILVKSKLKLCIPAAINGER